MGVPKYLCCCLLLTFTSQVYPQNYFPLEIGNRWDYEITTYCHGGSWLHSEISIEIVGDTIFNQDKNYFIFSNYWEFGSKYLRIENDSLYSYNVEDSAECLLFAYNQTLGSWYYSLCFFDSVFYSDEFNYDYFGCPDTQQVHSTTYISYEFSQKFGFAFSDDWHSVLCESWTYLSGCIISGITYGVLLNYDKSPEKNLNTYQLHQNYPNPFNPTTKIQYSIPAVTLRQAQSDIFVSLNVFDVLGNEIATLVKEEKPAGSYEVEFDASALPSGIYFYQLKAGEFIHTKKMVLMK